MREYEVTIVINPTLDDEARDEIIERVRKGALQKGIRSLVDIADERMHAVQENEPSKPDDLSLILFRKAATRYSPGR